VVGVVVCGMCVVCVFVCLFSLLWVLIGVGLDGCESVAYKGEQPDRGAWLRERKEDSRAQ